MAHYINADRLRAEIEQLLEFDGTVKTDYYIGKRDAELVILSFLDSLQQEQDILVINKKDWEAQEQFRKNKDFGKPLQQEQPEVDLEKEVEKYLLNNADFVTKSTSNEMVNTLARYFYELGKNARKEDK